MTETITPMMAQYLDIKAQYRDSILFYRMGDFYEMFFDDAVAAAEALDIALTRSGQHLGQDIPMCGVPVHSAEAYLLTLIRKGFRVAVAEQLEDPAEARKRGSKSVVRRDVVRLVTPGTLTEDALLEARRNNFLCAYSEIRSEASLAWVDISTGELRVVACPLQRLGSELARLSPREVLLSDDRLLDLDELIAASGAVSTARPKSRFDSVSSERRLKEMFGVQALDSFGSFERSDLSALGALVDYLDVTQRGKLPSLRPPIREVTGSSVLIDPSTRRSLELTTSLSGAADGSLVSAIDRTLTAGGARLLERRISAPSTDPATIETRLRQVDLFLEHREASSLLRSVLREVPDIDRALSRLSLDRAGPRDLLAVATGLKRAAQIGNLLEQLLDCDRVALLSIHKDLGENLCALLVESPPHLIRDGGFIAHGHNSELDEARHLRDEGRSVIAALQARYAELTGVSSLKIKHNNVLGYFIEVTAAHGSKLLSAPLSETFIHRQTTAGQVRFTTLELTELENRISNASARSIEIERQLFETAKATVVVVAAGITDTAAEVSDLDVSSALAYLAMDLDWCRPEVDDSRAFQVVGGRHPVVERALLRSGQRFIPNDCDLSQGETPAIWLITGPNMAGKSTFLRQNALIAVLAQAGSYVPAARARIGIVSQIFSRVGAADDLARGRSTFMVEMVETAAILNQADDRSFVILDEIGRGTATYDGLSIAWAVLEHLHATNRCRALFATHYHEMTALAGQHSGVRNATVTVKEWEGDVIFLHEVRPGVADRSYGVQVAKLAGLPATVIDRARIVLEALERRDREGNNKAHDVLDDLPLFAARPRAAAQENQQSARSAIEQKLEHINPDDLSPKDALRILYDLRDLLTERTDAAAMSRR